MSDFQPIQHEILQKMCDYSFGDQSGVGGCCPNAFVKKANSQNQEFVDRYNQIKQRRDYMSLYIDNIRLFKRDFDYSDWLNMKPISDADKAWLSQFDDEDLLRLCAEFPDMRFVIFTGFEDTPIQDSVFDAIPNNVVEIHAASSVVFGGKIIPFPYGLERPMRPGYDHHEIFNEFFRRDTEATRLLYVNCREDTGNRRNILPHFARYQWATTPPRMDYRGYIKGIVDHKFVLCPSGNGIDTIRGWETVYLKRVPVLDDHPYLRELYSDFPALYVNNFNEITESMLMNNIGLYEQAKQIDFDKLNLNKVYSNIMSKFGGLDE